MDKLMQYMEQHSATLEDIKQQSTTLEDIKQTCDELVQRVRHLEEDI